MTKEVRCPGDEKGAPTALINSPDGTDFDATKKFLTAVSKPVKVDNNLSVKAVAEGSARISGYELNQGRTIEKDSTLKDDTSIFSRYAYVIELSAKSVLFFGIKSKNQTALQIDQETFLAKAIPYCLINQP